MRNQRFLTKIKAGSKLLNVRLLEASGFLTRLTGLIGKRRIDPDFCMLFKRCGSVHTFFMSCHIDVVMTGPDSRVLKVFENVGPWRIVACRGAADTLEAAAGWAKRAGIKTGVKLVFPR